MSAFALPALFSRRAFVSACAAALVGLSLLAPGSASADHFEDLGGGWHAYENDRYGTRLVVPSFFTPEAAPENGDGRRFRSDDAMLEVYAWQNADGETAASLKARLIGGDGYADVTYSPSGRNWLVVSGFRGGNIFYEKYFFRAGTVHGFGIEFPRSQKPRYAPIIEEIEDSFRAGWSDG